MAAYIVSYKRDKDGPSSTNIVWADGYEQVAEEFAKCDWFAAHRAMEWEVKESRAKGMPERWLA